MEAPTCLLSFEPIWQYRSKVGWSHFGRSDPVKNFSSSLNRELGMSLIVSVPTARRQPGRLPDGRPVGPVRFLIEKNRNPSIATVVNLSANRGGLPEPEVAIEFTLPPECNSALDSAPRTEGDASEFVQTETYTPFRYNFKKFNPVQSAVLPIRSKENNIVISAKTSAGKTIAAELVLDDTLARGRKVIYLSPFKALTEERHADWKARYAGKNLVIMTGDYELSPELAEQLKSADIILMTSEMLDSRTRKFNQERNDWMREVGLVVLDEAHILSMPGRGDAVETGLMRLPAIAPTPASSFLVPRSPTLRRSQTG